MQCKSLPSHFIIRVSVVRLDFHVLEESLQDRIDRTEICLVEYPPLLNVHFDKVSE